MSQTPQTNKRTSRDIQAAERRQQILDIAKRLFAENGYHATSMRTLNKEIGMAEALTYHYFPGGKLEILRTVLQDAQEKRMKDIGEFVETFRDDMSLRDLLLICSRKMTDRFMNDKEYFQILLKERNLLEQEQMALLTELAQKPIDALGGYLAHRAAKGQIRDMDFPIAAAQFISQIAIIVFQKMLFQKDTDNENMERIVDFYVSLWAR